MLTIDHKQIVVVVVRNGRVVGLFVEIDVATFLEGIFGVCAFVHNATTHHHNVVNLVVRVVTDTRCTNIIAVAVMRTPGQAFVQVIRLAPQFLGVVLRRCIITAMARGPLVP